MKLLARSIRRLPSASLNTVNKLKGMATILFIAHQLPKGLAVDDVFSVNSERATQIRVIDEGQS